MVFTSTVFLYYFLPPLLVLYYAMHGRWLLPIKNFILLVFSLVFYAWGGVGNLFILLASVVVNYLGGLGVGLSKSRGAKRAFLILSLLFSLGLLGYYKYAGFGAGILNSLGIPVAVPSIVLPIGISFFTFQGVSYVIDVYRGDAGVQKNPLYVALYIALFPQLVAGPIVRYTTVEYEITHREHTLSDFSDGLVRFFIGFGKKMLLANAMGEIADDVFTMGSDVLTAPVAWVGAIAYSFQIYFDFSAYSDMAIGLGRMFGFHFLENFNYPYISDSITDFWRRWHISLSTWFRDYVYIPLGGNRCSKARCIFNLSVVWFLTGMWHGANWTFIAWRLYFGALHKIEKYLLGSILPKIPRAVRRVVTLVIVMIGWVLFRSDSIADAGRYLAVMFGGGGFAVDQAVYYIVEYLPEFILCIVASLPIKVALERRLDRSCESSMLAFLTKELGTKLFAFAVFVLSFIKLISGNFNPFIYFQF